MSDFSLMDAIECGVAKLPRVPVADNIPGAQVPVFRNLWGTSATRCPGRDAARPQSSTPLAIPVELQTGLEALYGDYKKTYDLWQEARVRVPPCFIVVCNNTSASKLVYDYISGFERALDDGSISLVNGRLELFRNYRRARQPAGAAQHSADRQRAA